METTKPHPNAKIWLAVTIGVIIITALVIGFYLYKTSQIGNKASGGPQKVATSSSSTKPVVKPADVSNDIKSINPTISDVKATINSLKSALAMFAKK